MDKNFALILSGFIQCCLGVMIFMSEGIVYPFFVIQNTFGFVVFGIGLGFIIISKQLTQGR